MKNQLSFSFLLVTACLLLSSSLEAQVSKTVNVATAGTLPTLIAAGEKDQITHLTVTGDLNGTDIRFIREMAGKNVINEKTAGKLSVLDLSQANIVAGGDYYYKDTILRIGNNEPRYTADNVFSRSMFYGFTGLTQVVLPNSITSIGDGAFIGCTGLTSMIIPDQVTSIGAGVFVQCTGLTSLTIGDHVTSIGIAALIGCTGLTSLTIPKSVTSIGWYAFSQSSIKQIHCKAVTPPSYEGSEPLKNSSKEVIQSYNEFTKRCKIYVPKGRTAAYKKADGWKNFKHIIEE